MGIWSTVKAFIDRPDPFNIDGLNSDLTIKWIFAWGAVAGIIAIAEWAPRNLTAVFAFIIFTVILAVYLHGIVRNLMNQHDANIEMFRRYETSGTARRLQETAEV